MKKIIILLLLAIVILSQGQDLKLEDDQVEV